MSRAGLRFWSGALAFAVFLVDVLTPLEGAVAVLYVVAILIAAKTNRNMFPERTDGTCLFLLVLNLQAAPADRLRMAFGQTQLTEIITVPLPKRNTLIQ